MTKPEALAQLRQAREMVLECERTAQDCNATQRRWRWQFWHEAVRNFREAV